MSAAKKIPNVLVDKITLMAYALSPHPCAQAIKQNLKIWREQQRVDAWETRHPDRPNKNISMRFVGECEEDGRHLVFHHDSALSSLPLCVSRPVPLALSLALCPPRPRAPCPCVSSFRGSCLCSLLSLVADTLSHIPSCFRLYVPRSWLSL